jgi:AcrR family transcriptional regulator
MGRPREFDIDKALDSAAELFWRNGYDRTSLSDLTAAIGITPPSFYFAFGSKEGLFKKVLDRYVSGQMGYFGDALQQPTARGVVERLLHGFADAYTHRGHPRGCLALNCGLPCSEDADGVRREIADRRNATRIELRKRLKRAKASGDLPADSDPDSLARYVMTIGYGMAVEAQSGASREDLYRTVALALQSWPG